MKQLNWRNSRKILACCALLLTASCSYDTILEPEYHAVCDSEVIYFDTDIQPLLASNCAQSGCHDSGSREHGIQYTDYVHIMRKGKVKPGDPTGSGLYKIITDQGGDVMPPPPRPRLTDAQVDLIYRWIEQGAKNITCTESNDCPTDQVGFAANIAPIIANKCQSCHHVANPSGGVRLDGHAQVAKEALTGSLLCSVKHLQGCKSMPQGSTKLPDCEIRQIEAWIDAGAPNN